MKNHWKDQLMKAMEPIDDRELYFGHNVEWELKGVRKFILKLEKLGVSNVEIPDDETIRFELPGEADCYDIFLHILTMAPKPSEVVFKKGKYNNRLTLTWRE